MKIQVGKLYISPLAGVVECIAERNNTFIVENDDYYFHVDAEGKVAEDGGKVEDYDAEYFNLMCEADFDVEQVK